MPVAEFRKWKQGPKQRRCGVCGRILLRKLKVSKPVRSSGPESLMWFACKECDCIPESTIERS